MASFGSTLTPLQREVVELLKSVPTGYVTGGTALADYLGHRQSLDIDLFVAIEGDMDTAEALLRKGASTNAWDILELRRFPGFMRYRIDRGAESTLVDIVHETVPQIVPVADKPMRDGLRVDSLDDLVANKLCAVLGRSEVKDVVDLYFLAASGIDVVAHVSAAHTKDGGMEPATLAFVLQQIQTDPAGLLLERQVSVEQLVAFRDQLVASLLKLAWPQQK